MYSLAAAADLTGLREETIREWARCYGLVGASSADSAERRFRDDEVRALAVMAYLVDVGWRPAEAASEVKGRSRRTGPFGAGATPVGRAHGAALDDLTTAFVAAAGRLDALGLSDILDAAWACFGPDRVADAWLLPALDRLGPVHGRAAHAAQAGRHIALDLARARLMSDYDDALRFLGAAHSRVLVGVAAGVRADLEALAIAVLLARAGVATTFLRAGVPDSAWVRAAQTCRTGHVVLAAPTPRDARRTSRLADQLRAAVPGLAIHVGGEHQHLVSPPVRTMGRDLATAADTLALNVAFDALQQRPAPRRESGDSA